MITVHHLADSRSQRILWLLEELGRDYEVVRYERDPKTMLAPEALKATHPLGKSPVVEVDGLTLTESGAIVQHLIGRDGPMAPAAPAQAAADLVWIHAAEGSLQPLLLMALVLRVLPERAPALVRPVARRVCDAGTEGFVRPRLADQLAHVDQALEGRDWLAGGEGPTGADVMMSFPLEAAESRGGGLDSYPNVAAYLGRIHARPAYGRALERGGPYAYGPKD
jgi:glutathione S-transferase